MQPRDGNRHAVFFTHPREAFTAHYERDPAELPDPRVTHALTLRVDGYGNVLRSAAIGYGRRTPDPTLRPDDQAQQTRTLVTVVEHGVTNPVEGEDCHLTPRPAETQSWELTGLPAPTGPVGTLNAFDAVQAAIDAATEIPYQQAAGEDDTRQQKRPLEHTRTRYRPDDLGAAADDPSALLPLAVVESLALPGETYQLAFPPGLAEELFGGRVTPDLLTAAGYVDPEASGGWWLPSGRAYFSEDPAATPLEESVTALAHGFVPCRYRDPFGQDTTVTLDAHNLLVTQTRDPLGNTVDGVNDYRCWRRGW